MSSFIANCKNYVNILEVLHITGGEAAEERGRVTSSQSPVTPAPGC